MTEKLPVIQEPVRGCQCSDAEQVAPHTCPYAEEINDNDRLCTCCDDCRHECAMDI